MAKSFYLEEEIYFTDKDVFKDKLEHPYDCTCYDGYARCVAVNCEENESVPQEIKVIYPLRKDIMKSKAKCRAILQYRGLYDLTSTDITYGDIMVLYGKVAKTN